MKYFLTIFFLLALVNSKEPNQSLFSFLENSSLTETDPCKTQTTKDQCLAQTLTDKNKQCCFIQNNKQTETCESSPNPLSDIANIVNSPQFKPLAREIAGYAKYSSSEKPIDIKSESTHVVCSDGELDINIGDEKYSDDDIKILTSADHCLNYTMSSIMNIISPQPQKEYDCTKGQLLQTSKDAGIECGTLTAKMNMNGMEMNLKTCMIFSYDMFSKINMPPMFNEQLKQQKVVLELSDSKGRKVTYDSETGKIVANNAGILTISKYLLLLSLFLF